MIALYIIFTSLLCVASAAKYESTEIKFYYGSKSDVYPLKTADQVVKNRKFKASLPTVIYFHGHNQHSETDDVKAVISAYLKNGGYNILFVDWRELAAAFYPISVFGMGQLGYEVAKVITKMVNAGYSIDKFHLVGHSLGAQLAGCTGRNVKKLSKYSLKIPRITGLDPAFPGFYIIVIGTAPISKHDAKFVDIIHTDAGLYGAPFRTGTVDFYPNGGHRQQPGCVGDLCSHQRSVYLWAESVSVRGKTFLASSKHIFKKVRIPMGNNCPVNAPPGKYYLKTNAESPFSIA